MRVLNSKKTFKIICLLLLGILIINNVFAPICSYAASDDTDDEDSDFGGKLFKPIAKLVRGMADGIISGLQYMFLGYGKISDSVELGDLEKKEYIILYGPKTIFSNKVPALNANFFKPKQESFQISDVQRFEDVDKKKIIEKSSNTMFEDADSASEKDANIENAKKEAYNAVVAEVKPENYGFNKDTATLVASESTATESEYSYKWKNSSDNKDYYLVCGYYIYDGIDQYVDCTITIYELDSTNSETQGKEIQYSASVLQGIISKWYRGLRTLALVGLLSVLVYVGIRIIISSTGQEKAKYKKMIGDWFAAICILFVLQYIMAFTVFMTDKLINVFSDSKVTAMENESVLNEKDELLSTMRNKAKNTDGIFKEIFAETVMYVALVTLTCIFTIQYLKRFIYLAFLTMIAPLIALTYPLDKIKDRTSTSIYIVG